MPPALVSSPSCFELPHGSQTIIRWPPAGSTPRPHGRGGPASTGFEVSFPPSLRCPATLVALRLAGSLFGRPHTVTFPESVPVLEPLGLLSGSSQGCSVESCVTVPLI